VALPEGPKGHRDVRGNQVLDELLNPDSTNADVWGDGAYRAKGREAALREDGWRGRIHRKAQKGKPPSARARAANSRPFPVRAWAAPSSKTV
jgi:IS5 family transposase